jgi:peroxiredoxin
VSGAFWASYIALWVAVIVLSVAVFALYHHFGQLYLNSPDGRVNQGPEAGKALEPFVATTDTGRLNVPDGTATVLAFMEVGCLLCSDLRHHLRTYAMENRDVRVIAVVGGKPDEIDEFAAPMREHVAVVSDVGGKITSGYGVAVFPFAVAIDPGGVVRAKDIVNKRDSVERLGLAAVGSRDHREEGSQ